MPKYSVMAVILLSGCGQGAPQPMPGQPIDCAIGDTALARVCSAEVRSSPSQSAGQSSGQSAGQFLLLHHPDGGIRRLRIVTDGRGVIVADGAEPAQVTLSSERLIDVRVGPDRYLLPATIARASTQ